jgi:hypothetical protein
MLAARWMANEAFPIADLLNFKIRQIKNYTKIVGVCRRATSCVSVRLVGDLAT